MTDPYLYGPPQLLNVFLESEMTPRELLLACMIHGLSLNNKFNACYATNARLAKMVKVQARQIREMLRNLKRLGVIAETQPDADPHRKTHQRYLIVAWSYRPFDPSQEEALDRRFPPETGGAGAPGGEALQRRFPPETGGAGAPTDSIYKNDSKGDSNKPPYSPPTGDRLPDALNTERFRHWWDKWLVHRKEIKKTLTPTARETQLKKLEKMGEQQSIEAIEHSIASGYTGIFPPSGSNGNGAKLAGRYVEGPDGRTWRLGRDPGADSGLDFRERSILKSGYDPF